MKGKIVIEGNWFGLCCLTEKSLRNIWGDEEVFVDLRLCFMMFFDSCLCYEKKVQSGANLSFFCSLYDLVPRNSLWKRVEREGGGGSRVKFQEVFILRISWDEKFHWKKKELKPVLETRRKREVTSLRGKGKP